MNSKATDKRALALGHDKSMAGQDPSLPGANLCFHLQTMEVSNKVGKLEVGMERRKGSDSLCFLPGNIVRPKLLSVSAFYSWCEDCLAFVRMVLSGGQCCMAQRPGANMPRAVCLSLSGCVAVERHSTLPFSSICKMGLSIKGGKTGVW